MAVVWVSLGLQPCAIAAVADADCPHRAQQQSAPATHHDHGVQQDGGHCDVAESPCCDVAAVAIDGRLNPVKADAGDDVDELVSLSALRLVPEPDRMPDKPFEAVLAPPSPRPLHVLYCVYLD